MRLPTWLFTRLLRRADRIMSSRPPDFVIGPPDAPYLSRWWVLPPNRYFNAYVHRFHRSDDDRALHDHPWPWCSIILSGGYIEHTIAAGGVHRRKWQAPGTMRFGVPRAAHRIELVESFPCLWEARTLFIRGPKVREWGFHCPRGWRHWRQFTADTEGKSVGQGCD